MVAAPPVLLERCQHLFCFYIVALEMQGSRSAFVWPIFQAMAFPIGLLTGAVVDSEKSNRGAIVLATQSARCHLGAKVLSLPNLSGWSAKPNRGLVARLIMGAIITAFRKRFSRRHILSLLYALPMIDVLPWSWESPPPRVPEQHSGLPTVARHEWATVSITAPGARGDANTARPLRPWPLWDASH